MVPAIPTVLRLILPPASSTIRRGPKVVFCQLLQKFQELRSDVKTIQFALRGIVTRHELEHLIALSASGPYPVQFGGPLWRELERLDAIGFISPTAQANGRLDTIRNRFGDETIPVEKREQFDLKDYIQITNAAREYLNLLAASSKTK